MPALSATERQHLGNQEQDAVDYCKGALKCSESSRKLTLML